MGQVTAGILAICGLLTGVVIAEKIKNEKQAKTFLAEYNTEAIEMRRSLTEKKWNFMTNYSEENEKQFVEYRIKDSIFSIKNRLRALEFDDSSMSADTQRKLKKIRNIGIAAQPDNSKAQELVTVIGKMSAIYSTAKVCVNPYECLPLQPDLTQRFANSRNYSELSNLWASWHNETGRKIKEMYPKYVNLSNDAISHAGFKDLGEEWRSAYESDTILDELKELFDTVRPLYEQLHAYVRRELQKVYGKDKFPSTGHIPAHILGSILGNDWQALNELVKPHPDTPPTTDITSELTKQNYTAQKIFKTAEDFFVSLGFEKLPESFWNKSLLERPTDGRVMNCQPTSWDFGDGEDFRISMCTDITQDAFVTAHQELAHVMYYRAYKTLPVVYRAGPHPGFQEAIGDTISLSIKTPQHFSAIGLLNETTPDNKAILNSQMKMALLVIAFLPYGYLIDQWRYGVFSGNITPENYNKEWWRLRCELQGVSPPVARSDDDFDPGSVYHVAASVPFMRYFTGFIEQFQFFDSLCKTAKQKGQLVNCDIYNSTDVGKKLGNVMKIGSSKPWNVAMKILTGQKKMKGGSLIKYFKPLLNFLKSKNKKDTVGWSNDCPKQ